MKKIVFVLLSLALGASANATFGQKGKPNPKPTPTPIINVIADNDADGIALDIQSDFAGPYQGGVDSIVSGVGSGWELSLLASTTRMAQFSFGDPVPGSVPTGMTPPSDGAYRTRFLSQCFTGILADLTLGSTLYCNLIVAIDVGADRYSLRFYAANYPGTNDIRWTCTGAVNGKCNSWRVQSNNDSKIIAQLLKVTTQRNKTVTTNYGQYRFSFDITVTR